MLKVSDGLQGQPFLTRRAIYITDDAGTTWQLKSDSDGLMVAYTLRLRAVAP